MLAYVLLISLVASLAAEEKTALGDAQKKAKIFPPAIPGEEENVNIWAIYPPAPIGVCGDCKVAGEECVQTGGTYKCVVKSYDVFPPSPWPACENCKETEKCVETDATYACVNTTPKAGICEATTKVYTQCQYDSQCADSLKCCSGQCLNPK